MCGWVLPLRHDGTRAGRDENTCRGALQRFHHAPASTASPWNRLLRISR